VDGSEYCGYAARQTPAIIQTGVPFKNKFGFGSSMSYIVNYN